MTQTMTVSIDGIDVELPVLPGRRVAACIKACEGLETESLEACRVSLKQIDLAFVIEQGAQRCSLLAALTGLVLFTKPKPFNSVALNRAHQAIANATGGAA
jgi:hypothetical protein